MTHVITLTSHKGGCAKTTSAATMGGVLSRAGKRVLLVDLDSQTNLTYSFADKGSFPQTIYDAFFSMLGKDRSKRVPLPIYGIAPMLDIVPGSFDLRQCASMFSGAIGAERMLRNLLRDVAGQYDFVIIDTPSQMEFLTLNALVAADEFIVPISCDKYSLDGIQQLIDVVGEIRDSYNESLSCLGILMTRVRPRQTVDVIVEEELRGEYSDLVFGAKVRECADAKKAPLLKTDIVAYRRGCTAAQDYLAFCGELLGRLGEEAAL